MAFCSCSGQPPDTTVPLAGPSEAGGFGHGSAGPPDTEGGPDSLQPGDPGDAQPDGPDSPQPGDPGNAQPGDGDAPAVPDGSGLTAWFIDVRQADSALVVCDGHAMLIDGGNPGDSSRIYSFLKTRGISHLDYIVATHADEDHVGGLPGALNFATAGMALSPVADSDIAAFWDFVKYLGRQGVGITIPAAGDEFPLGAGTVKILGPVNPTEKKNNTSIVLRIVYGRTSFLFTGDAEREEEADILGMGYDLQSTVLKVGHHGSNTSTTYPFLREVMPTYAIVSVGAGNPYGHPDENVLSRLRDAGAAVYRTDLNGTVPCTSDGETVTVLAEKDAAAPGGPQAPAGTETAGSPAPQDMYAYIGNINTHVFHSPSCRSLPLEKNRVYFETRDEAVDGGFRPCGQCNP